MYYVSSFIYIFKFEVTQDYKTENTFQKKYLEEKSCRKTCFHLLLLYFKQSFTVVDENIENVSVLGFFPEIVEYILS